MCVHEFPDLPLTLTGKGFHLCPLSLSSRPFPTPQKKPPETGAVCRARTGAQGACGLQLGRIFCWDRIAKWSRATSVVFCLNILRDTEADCVSAVEGTQKRQVISFAVDLVPRVTSEKSKWKSPVILK